MDGYGILLCLHHSVIKRAQQIYSGLTENLDDRVKEHNQGKCVHTLKHIPQQIKTAISFTNREKAIEFEKYLKTSLGRAFAKKRL